MPTDDDQLWEVEGDLIYVGSTYPQASLRADRQATIRGDGLPLAEGLKLELDLTAPTAWDEGTAAGLHRYNIGDRPQAPVAS